MWPKADFILQKGHPLSIACIGKGEVVPEIRALEIVVVTHGVAASIRDAKTPQISTAIQTGKKLGMQLLNEDLVRLAREHQIDADEAYGKAIYKTDMADKLPTAGFRIEAAP